MANRFTSNGRGVVLFIEDIDKILQERTNITNEISLLMDGSETKHNNIISIFSTNHIENIDPTFLRGKRIGSIVTLTYLDKKTAKNMMEFYLGDVLKDSCDIAAEKIEEYKIVPAFLSEIIDRVKTHLVLRDTTQISEKDILISIDQFKRQMDIARVKVNTLTEMEVLDKATSKVFAKHIKEFMEESGTTEMNNKLKQFLKENM